MSPQFSPFIDLIFFTFIFAPILFRIFKTPDLVGFKFIFLRTNFESLDKSVNAIKKAAELISPGIFKLNPFNLSGLEVLIISIFSALLLSLTSTTLKNRQEVNIEVDILARYIDKNIIRN